LCTVFVAVGQPLPYQPAYRSQALRALQALYNLHFSRAEGLLDQLERQFGPYAGTSYLRALAYSWRIELDPTTTWFDSFWERELERTDSLLRCCAHHPLDRYFLGFGQRALEVRRLYIRGHTLASVWKARDLIALLSGIRQYASQYPEMQFELGLYEYYIAYFAQNYPLMRPVLRLFPPGNAQKGLERLEACARDSLNYTQHEAAYFLSYIYLYQAHQPEKAEYWARRLSERFPDNPLFRRMWAEALHKLQRYEEARQAVLPWLQAYEKACPTAPCRLLWSRYPTSEAIQAYALLGMILREEKRYAEAQAAFARMDTLLKKLPHFPAPTYARLQREAALLEKRMGNSAAAQARLEALRHRSDVPEFLKAPLPE